MCATDRQLVWPEPRADATDRPSRVRSGRGLAVTVRPDPGPVAAAGLTGLAGLGGLDCTTPAMPQLARASTGTVAAIAIRAGRPMAVSRHSLRRS